jgi:hypothetical protein
MFRCEKVKAGSTPKPAEKGGSAHHADRDGGSSKPAIPKHVVKKKSAAKGHWKLTSQVAMAANGKSTKEQARAQVAEKMHELLATCGSVGTDLMSEKFTKSVREHWATVNLQDGFLHGMDLYSATQDLLPEGHGAAVGSDDLHEMEQILYAFGLLEHIDADSGLSSPEDLADFVRFCLAWRLHTYFEAPKIAHTSKFTLDLVIFCGPYAMRRDWLVAELLVADRGVFEFPVTVTSRPQAPWEVDGVHHHFTSEEAFDADAESGAFLAHWEHACGRYAITADACLAPSSKGNVAILTVPGDSAAAKELSESETIRAKAVYVAAPPEAYKDAGNKPVSELVAGDLADYYNTDKISWEVELWRKDETWDLMIDGALSDKESFEKLQTYLVKATHEHRAVTSASKRKEIAQANVVAPYLSSEHLFETIEGLSTRMSMEDFLEVWNLSEWLGLTSEFVEAFGGTERPKRKRVEELFKLYVVPAKDGDGKMILRPTEFRLFLQNLAVEMHLAEDLVITVLTHAAGDDLYLTPPLIELWYVCAGKPDDVGGRFDFADFAKLCLETKWLDPQLFGEGHMSLVFDSVCKYQPHGGSQPATAACASSVATKTKLSASKTREETKDDPGDAAGAESDAPRGRTARRPSLGVLSQSISSKKEFDYLLELVAERRRERPLELLLALKKTGKAIQDGVDMVEQ